MDRKKLILALVAAIIAIGTGLMARSMFAGASAPQAQAAVPAQPQGPKVLVAKRALPLGTIITADAVGYQLWPKELVQDAYFVDGEADMSKLLGTVVRYPITAGQPVTQGALVAPGDRGFLAAALGPGMRAVTVSVSEKTGVGGFVFPGDHVDLMLTESISSQGDAADNSKLSATETILHNLRVLATDQSTESTTNDEGKTVVKAFHTVTLEATPKIAEKIAVAQTLGTLSLSLRSLADSQSDLDRAVAESNFKVPNGLSKDAESKLLTKVSSPPQEGGATVTTGGEVSRFQRSSLASKAPPSGRASGAPGEQAQTGPSVRVFRGQAVTVQPIVSSINGMVNQQAKGASRVGGTTPGATAASMIEG